MRITEGRYKTRDGHSAIIVMLWGDGDRYAKGRISLKTKDKSVTWNAADGSAAMSTRSDGSVVTYQHPHPYDLTRRLTQ